MESVGIDEFREKLAIYVIKREPVEVTKNGVAVGYFVPTKKEITKEQIDELNAAKRAVDEMVASWGLSEDELMEEVEKLRQESREKKRNAG
jgi:hypothetical protein